MEHIKFAMFKVLHNMDYRFRQHFSNIFATTLKGLCFSRVKYFLHILAMALPFINSFFCFSRHTRFSRVFAADMQSFSTFFCFHGYDAIHKRHDMATETFMRLSHSVSV
jgi:hypothetical protein